MHLTYSRVPGDFGELLLAGVPFRAGKKARRYFNQARNEFEDTGGGPRMSVASAIFAHVESVGHASEGDILDDHFPEELEGLGLERIVFQMAAVGSDAQAERDFFGANFGGGHFGLTGELDLAFPFDGHEAPARVEHLGQVNGSRRDVDLLANAINLFHRAPPAFLLRTAYTWPRRMRAIGGPLGSSV